jgi:diguanylate cyclase (GGDEF)-like protein
MTEARTDALAGVANRRALDEELARRYAAWQRQETPFSLLIIDADHFKKFNDTHGHQAGDAVLRNMGRVLAATARDMDFVARYGGEEFALVLPGAEIEDAKSVAERIRNAIAEMKLAFAGKNLEVTVSVGAAAVRPGDTVTSLTQHADTALYAAKSNGRNCSYYYERGACLPVDPGAVAGKAETAGVVRQQLVEVAPENGPGDRRMQPRHSFARVQRIAPYVAGRAPAAEDFHDVQCRDLSSSGISFWMRSPPEFSSLVLALAGGDAVKYLVAEVMRTVPVRHGDKTVYIVGCRFTGRLDLERKKEVTPVSTELETASHGAGF